MKRTNKRGFSLIELLAVIVILGILTSIVTFSVSSIKKKKDLKNCENLIKNLLVDARRYTEKNPSKLNDLKEKDDEAYIKINDLLDAKMINSDELINPINKLEIKDDITVTSCDAEIKKIKFSYKNICANDGTVISDDGCKQQ